MPVLLVFLASGLGGVLRHLLGGWAASRLGPSFPVGTIAINVVGSFLLVGVLEADGYERYAAGAGAATA